MGERERERMQVTNTSNSLSLFPPSTYTTQWHLTFSPLSPPCLPFIHHPPDLLSSLPGMDPSIAYIGKIAPPELLQGFLVSIMLHLDAGGSAATAAVCYPWFQDAGLISASPLHTLACVWLPHPLYSQDTELMVCIAPIFKV